jgi:hypothetical protein
MIGMKHGMLVVIAVLSALPVVLFAGFGAWALYHSGHWVWLWWTLPVCWGLSGLLARRWARELIVPLPDLDRQTWTPRDAAAMQLVEVEQARVGEYAAAQLTDPQFYTKYTQELALKLARHYHPEAADPLGKRSVVEILAATRLIAEDVEEWFLKYVPASHLVTVEQWRLLQLAPSWWRTASHAGWIASVALNPLNFGRYLVSKLTIEPFTGQVQQQLLGTFFTLYVRQAGYYLIELNSGRLQGGSKRYRAWMERLQSTAAPEVVVDTPTAATPPEPARITVAVIGQVKAGKSSLINALLGEQRAVVDILPATAAVQRHRLHWPDRADELMLLDTPGYSDAGATPGQLRETQAAVAQADLVLLVLDARSPARQADVATLAALRAAWDAQSERTPPAVVVVVNHVDGLSPVMEWAPPYGWETPVTKKEQTIAAAVAYAREVFGGHGAEYLPVCAEPTRVWNVSTGLVMAMSRRLPGARSTALLRALHDEFRRDRIRQVAGQVLEAGQKLLESWTHK